MLAALLTIALAAVPGTPEPQPGDAGGSGLWVGVGNDFLGLPPGPDDNRTAEATAGSRMGRWSLVVDDSMLTHFDDASHLTGCRSDEVTATLGYELSPGLVLGVGWRARGSLGGAAVQDWAHRALGAGSRVGVPYGRRSSSPLAYGVYISGETPDGLGYETVSSVLATADGDVATDQASRAVLRWRWAALWAGPRAQWRHYPGAAEARRHVDDFERGLWVDAGVRLGWLTFASSYSLRARSAVGTVTVYLAY